MTGSRHIGGGSGSRHDIEPCNEIDFTTSIASPNPDIVPRLKQGDILQVVLQERKGKKFVALIHKSDIAGSITERVNKLSSCIKEGFSFEAEVRSVHGGAVEINVRSS